MSAREQRRQVYPSDGEAVQKALEESSMRAQFSIENSEEVTEESEYQAESASQLWRVKERAAAQLKRRARLQRYMRAVQEVRVFPSRGYHIVILSETYRFHYARFRERCAMAL